MKSYKVTAADVIRVSPPDDTRTYKRITNMQLIDSVRKHISNAGLTIRAEGYMLGMAEQIAIGKYAIADGSGNGMEMVIGWMNSYNKTKSLRIGAGANVLICSNGMFSADFTSFRKHTGSIQDDLDELIVRAVGEAETQFLQLSVDKSKMESVWFSEDALPHLLGEIYFKEELVKAHQVSLLRKNLTESKNFRIVAPEEHTLWNLYSQVTEVLKFETPQSYVQAHIDTHKYFMKKVAQFTGESLSEEPATVVEAEVV
jgi:hypothetical protein